MSKPTICDTCEARVPDLLVITIVPPMVINVGESDEEVHFDSWGCAMAWIEKRIRS